MPNPKIGEFMAEKLASSEIAQSRERFENAVKRIRPEIPLDRYADSGEYENSSVWAMWFIWPEAERDTRERCTQTAERIRDKFVKLGMKANAYGADYVAERIRGKE